MWNRQDIRRPHEDILVPKYELSTYHMAHYTRYLADQDCSCGVPSLKVLIPHTGRILDSRNTMEAGSR